MNFVDYVLVSSFVCRYDTKIICIRKSNIRLVTKFVTSVRVILEILQDWVNTRRKITGLKPLKGSYLNVEYKIICKFTI